MAEFAVLVLIGALSSATPLVLAGLGEAVLERAGAGFNLGLEGTMLVGALAGVLGSAVAGPWAGLGTGVLAGVAFGGLYATGMSLGVDTVLVGIALTLLGIGLTSYLVSFTSPADDTALSVATLPTVSIPGLDQLPLVGALFTGTSVTVYLAIVATGGTWWMLRSTRFGLRLRAVGDDAEAAAVRGISIRGYRSAASVIAGAFGGAAGAVLSLASIGTFASHMAGGRGFIALAVVIIAHRNPVGVAGAALLIGVFDSLALLAQTRQLGLPVEAYQVMPWIAAFMLLYLDGRRRSRRAQHISLPKELT